MSILRSGVLLLYLLIGLVYGISDQTKPTVDPQRLVQSKISRLTMSPLPPRPVFLRSRPSAIPPLTIRNVTTQEGQTVYLHCIAGNVADKSISWIRLKDFHLLTVGLYTYTTDERFQPIHMPYSNDWALQIRYAQPSDEGIYECQISSEPAISHYVYLRIVVPQAKIPGGPDLFVEAGSAINLTCIISQSPEPPVFVFWYHEQRMINYDSSRGDITVQKLGGDTAFSRLYIVDAQPADSGNYTCCPSNTDATSIMVHVIKGEKQAAVQNDAAPPPKSSADRQARSILLLLIILLFQRHYWR